MNLDKTYNYIDVDHDDEDVIVVKPRILSDEISGLDAEIKADAEINVNSANDEISQGGKGGIGVKDTAAVSNTENVVHETVDESADITDVVVDEFEESSDSNSDFSSKSLKPDVNRHRTTLEDLEKLPPVSLTQKIVVALSVIGVVAFLVFFFVFK